MFLPFWQRLLATVITIFVVSYVIGVVWQLLLGFALPSYVAGIVGGLVALPVWHLLKRIRPSKL